VKYEKFRQTVWDFYTEHGRSFPWRNTDVPYRILVSEIMLQQTQATRVVPKYRAFLKAFPSMRALANASARDVLAHWSGLGYNRRARNLHRLAKLVTETQGGKLPITHHELTTLPGIGHYTAGAIMAFAHNLPHPILETNIRTVYIHHFFKNKTDVTDNDIMKKVAATLDTTNPREWYWALMDYGAHLKETVGNVSQNSKAYTKQKPFKGSDRAIRGAIIKLLIQKPYAEATLIKCITADKTLIVDKTPTAHKTRIQLQLATLTKENFIEKKASKWQLTS